MNSSCRSGALVLSKGGIESALPPILHSFLSYSVSVTGEAEGGRMTEGALGFSHHD